MKGILFSQMQPPAGWEDDFHRWYETDHIPARMVLDGWAAANRYVCVNGTPSFLAVYELDDLAALETDVYRELKRDPSAETTRMLTNLAAFTRFTCQLSTDTGPARAPAFVSVVAFAVPADRTRDFDEWYENEHTPRLMLADDWLRVRRYRVLSGEGGDWTHLALHDLGSLDVLWSKERAHARTGALRDALDGHEWFDRSGRWLYRPITRHVSRTAPERQVV